VSEVETLATDDGAWRLRDEHAERIDFEGKSPGLVWHLVARALPHVNGITIT
jgi:hypothetical protein